MDKYLKALCIRNAIYIRKAKVYNSKVFIKSRNTIINDLSKGKRNYLNVKLGLI